MSRKLEISFSVARNNNKIVVWSKGFEIAKVLRDEFGKILVHKTSHKEIAFQTHVNVISL